MKRVKRIAISVLMGLTLILSFVGLTACGTGINNFKLSFIVDNEVYEVIETTGNESITIPENPTKNGYTFDGWYWDNNTWQKPFTANSLLDAPISSDMKVYAKFTQNSQSGDLGNDSGNNSGGDSGGNSNHQHNYSTPTYNWSADNSTCTATRVCASDSSHIETETVNSASLVMQNKTCELDELTKYTATFSNTAFAVQVKENIKTANKLGHSFTNYVSNNDATYEKDGTETATCNHNGCNEKDTRTDAGSMLKVNGITFKTLTVNNGNTVYGKVANGTTTFSFTNEVEKSGNADYGVYLDIYCNTDVKSKTVPLITGDNTFYILAENTDNGDVLYTVTIRVKPMYTVSFNTLGGSAVASQSIEEDAFVTMPQNPTKTGYTFKGWDFDFDTAITVNTTVTVNSWQANTYAVSFDGNGVANPNSQQVTYDSAYGELPTLTRNGYTFNGWYTALTGGTKVLSTDTVKITTATTLYASWTANEYTVSFSNGTGYTITATKNGQSFTSGSEITIEDKLIFTVSAKDGYTAGTIIASGENRTFNNNELSGVYENITVSSSATANTYIVSFDGSGVENPDSIQVTYDSVYGELPTLTRTGYEFKGWTTTKDGSTFVDSSTTVKTANNHTLYAHWNINSYNVSLSQNISSAGTVSGGKSQEYNTSITVNATTCLGYDFIGWYDGDNLVTQDLQYTFNIPANNVTLIAKWELKAEMANFKFYSTATSCTITGVIDEAIIEISIPDCVTTIGTYNLYAFQNCHSLTSITIPNSVTHIGNYAFYGCYKLVEIINKSSLIITIGSEKNGYVGYYAKQIITDKADSNITTTVDGYAFYNDNETYYLIGYNGTKTDLTLPENINGNNYDIYQYAFYNNENITSVKMSDNITGIGDYAFCNCNKLQDVYINNIETWCNIDFSGLNNPLYYGANLYLNNELLTNLVIPNTITTIKEYAFYKCYSLESITIPDSVTSIGDYAFYGCSSLTEINFNATAMEDLSSNNYVFADAGQGGSGITVNIGANVKKIPDFLYCPSYQYPSHAPKIASVIFTENSACTTIGYGAFYKCVSLISVAIPDSVTSIDKNAFYGCSSLQDVYISDIKAWCNIDFSDSNNPLYYGANLYLNNELVTNLVIPSTVTEIKDYAFYNCDSLESITIPDSITSMGSYAFYNCMSLTEINFNATAMEDLSSENYVFFNVGQSGDGITINIGVNVTKMPAYLFYDCTNLTEINFNATAVADLASENYVFYNAGNSKSGIMVNIGANVTKIPAYLFCPYGYDGSPKITTVAFAENSVCESIGCSAFSCCLSLISITIPNSVTSISDYAFNNCEALTEINFNATAMTDLSSNNYVFTHAGRSGNGITVNIGANVTKIPAYLFSPNYFRPSKIKNVVFAQNSVCESIGYYAFGQCYALTSVTMPDCVTSIGDGAFYDCESLITITIGSGVTSIGNWAFYNCSSLTSITIPDSVTIIGNSAFDCCSSLTSITIPNSVTSIGSYAFASYSLLSMTFEDTSTWYYTDAQNHNYKGGRKTDISRTRYFEYVGYYWYKIDE